jgi:hypothetical protein
MNLTTALRPAQKILTTALLAAVAGTCLTAHAGAFTGAPAEVHVAKREIVPFKKEIAPLKKEATPLKKETVPLKKEITPLKKEIAPLA